MVDPNWKISLETSDINRHDVQAFVKFAVGNLSDAFHPSVVALKLQFMFATCFSSPAIVIKNHRDGLLEKLRPLETEIVEASSMNHEDLQRTFKQMVCYLTLRHGLGNPAVGVVSK